jgi:hypothetical protein
MAPKTLRFWAEDEDTTGIWRVVAAVSMAVKRDALPSRHCGRDDGDLVAAALFVLRSETSSNSTVM